ncbi:threonine/serine exporter family protein [Pectinatus haikarae]|uniref:threonine/serine ThrE exporter family protein n=1 Tax=Pectinatus haikarae TaxID=349096 RepID=UPI001E4E267C|nr:threonine/serine exporter family protein [Pectinatus haikarae]
MTEQDNEKMKLKKADMDKKIRLILRTGQLLMENAADTNRIVKTMKRTAGYMDIADEYCNIHVTYTTLMINVSMDGYSITKFQKCCQHNVNMALLAGISRLSWRAIEEDFSLDRYERALDKLESRDPRYTPLIIIIGAALACGGVSRLFGGDWTAFFYTAVCAAIGVYLRIKCDRWQINTYMGIAIAAFAATVCAYFASYLPYTDTPWHPMLTCAIFIVPGIPLINSIDDLLDNYITAGTTRAINTVLMIGSMSFGIVFAIKICHVADFTDIAFSSENAYWVYAVAAFIAAAGFSTMFNVPPQFLWVVGLGGSIAVCIRNFLNFDLTMGQPVGTLVGAMVISFIAIKAVHWFHVPAHVLVIPSVIPLMPGVFMYRLMFAIINTDIMTEAKLVQAVQNGVNASLVILAIGVGVAIPNIFARKYIHEAEQKNLQKAIKKRYLKRLLGR